VKVYFLRRILMQFFLLLQPESIRSLIFCLFTMSEDGKHLTIREWSEEDRPREKMIMKGSASLSDAELLAILIGSGNRRESAVDLAKRIMSACNHNINDLARLGVIDLVKKFRGIGQARAVSIIAALELGRRRKTKDAIEKKKVVSSRDLQELFEPILMDLMHEEFWVVLLDGGNKVLDKKRITQGGAQYTVVDLPMILKSALDARAISIAVAHNHPSGQNMPSREDDKITQRIRSGCEAIGLRFIDHVIIARDKYYSYCDEGKL
jgi:DNA repair protein RadC